MLPGAEYVEMERNSEKSFCCGAGGARMWMEENIGERINVNRTNEAVGTGADQIAVGCPFCRVMLSDGLTSAQATGTAREEVEVLDVAQMLLASVKGESATRAKVASHGAAAPSSETRAEPVVGSVTVTQTSVAETADVRTATEAGVGSSLFDVAGDAPAEEKPAATAETRAEPSGGGSLFDLGGDDAPAELKAEPEAEAKDEPAPAEKKPAPAEDLGSGGSLFDLEPPAKPEPAAQAEPQVQEKPKVAEKPKAAAKPAPDLSSGESLFDIAAPEVEQAPQPKQVEEPKPKPNTDADISGSSSLFDL